MTEQFSSFGARGLGVAKRNPATGLYEPVKMCTGIQSISIEPIASSYTLEGDDTIQATETIREGYTFSFEFGVLDYETLAVLEGGTIEKDPTTQAFIKYVNNVDDKFPEFAIIGFVKGSKDIKVLLPVCKVESLSRSYATKEYAVVSVSGTAIKNADGVLKVEKFDSAAISDADITSMLA